MQFIQCFMRFVFLKRALWISTHLWTALTSWKPLLIENVKSTYQSSKVFGNLKIMNKICCNLEVMNKNVPDQAQIKRLMERFYNGKYSLFPFYWKNQLWIQVFQDSRHSVIKRQRFCQFLTIEAQIEALEIKHWTNGPIGQWNLLH